MVENSNNAVIPEIIESVPQGCAEVDLAQIIKLQQIIEDYEQLRNVVLHNLLSLKEMSDNVKGELELEGFNPELVSSWNSLINTSNQSLKLLTGSYKDISSIILNIHKINSLNPKPKETETFKVENISDVIKRIRKPE